MILTLQVFAGVRCWTVLMDHKEKREKQKNEKRTHTADPQNSMNIFKVSKYN